MTLARNDHTAQKVRINYAQRDQDPQIIGTSPIT